MKRFLDAQTYDVMHNVYSELAREEKKTHWLWFIFPQRHGLSQSELGKFYGIRSYEEARCFAKHPLLGSRLIRCTGLVLLMRREKLEQMFNEIDRLKLKSSMEMFALAVPEEIIFQAVLDRFFPKRQNLLHRLTSKVIKWLF